MKSTRLTKYQIAAVANYLLGTEHPICVALHACYIEAEEGVYFADELDSVSKSYLDELIFKCALCDVWSQMFENSCEAIWSGRKPSCEICSMSPDAILFSDIRFLRKCGIVTDILKNGKPMGLRAVLFNWCPEAETSANSKLKVTDDDLDFLCACGIRVRLSSEDAARRKRVTEKRDNL